MIPPVIHHGGLHALVLCAPDSLKVRTLERELDNTKSSKHSDHSEPRGKRAQVTARGKKRKSAIVTVNRSEIEEKKVMVDLTGTITDEQIVPTFGLHGRLSEGKRTNQMLTLLDPRLPDAVYALQKSLSVPSTEPGEIVSMVLFLTSTMRTWACESTRPSIPGSKGANLLPSSIISAKHYPPSTTRTPLPTASRYDLHFHLWRLCSSVHIGALGTSWPGHSRYRRMGWTRV